MSNQENPILNLPTVKIEYETFTLPVVSELNEMIQKTIEAFEKLKVEK